MSETAWWIVIGISAGLLLGGSSVIGLQVDAWLRRRERLADWRIEREAWEQGRPIRELREIHRELLAYLRLCVLIDRPPSESPWAAEIADLRDRMEAKDREIKAQLEELAQ